MVEMEYANAYSEVLGILKKIPKEDYKKIPKTKIKTFEEFSNKEYTFHYNPSNSLDEQNISKRAKAIIAILFRDYWATDAQREKIIAKQKNDRIKLEEKKKERYNVNNIFKDKRRNIQQEEKENNNAAMLGYKESIFRKVVNKIKEIFYK